MSPFIVKEYKKSFLFGLVKIDYYVEDRRPDLEPGVDAIKYKHFLNIKIINQRLNWTFRTQFPYEDLPFENTVSLYKSGHYDKQNTDPKLECQ